jgi:hypothetical protein
MQRRGVAFDDAFEFQIFALRHDRHVMVADRPLKIFVPPGRARSAAMVTARSISPMPVVVAKTLSPLPRLTTLVSPVIFLFLAALLDLT